MTSPRERIAELCADESVCLLRAILVEDGLPVESPFVVNVLAKQRRDQMAMWMSRDLIPDESINALAELSDDEARRGFREWIEPDIRRAIAPRRPS